MRLRRQPAAFYAEFQQLAEEIARGARLLEAMVMAPAPLSGQADEINELEHRCDAISHSIINRLNRTFVTPLDREDIYAMARSLDDVMDAIDGAAGTITRYRFQQMRAGSAELTAIVRQAAEHVVLAVGTLERQPREIATHARQIDRLENEADLLHQQAVGRLFDEEADPIAVIKWKETFDLLETAADRCQDVANVLEGIVIKHS